MSVPFDTGRTFCGGGRGVGSRWLTALLGLVKDPDNQPDEKGYDRHPEQQREQHAEEAASHHGTTHHGAHAAHHAASTEGRNEQQNDDRPDQDPKEYFQTVAHGLSSTSLFVSASLFVSELSIPRKVCDFMSKIAQLPDQLLPIERAPPMRRPGALSVRGMQPGQGDREEPADRGFGRQTAGCRECVEAVGSKLLGRDVIPDVARIRGLSKQLSDDVREVLLRSVGMLTSMQERREFAGVALVLD